MKARDGMLWVCSAGHARQDAVTETIRENDGDRYYFETEYLCGEPLQRSGPACPHEGCECQEPVCRRPVQQVDRMQLAFERAAAKVAEGRVP